MLRSHEQLPRHLAHDREHVRIEHVPGTHLLLDHLLADVYRLHRAPVGIGLISVRSKARQGKGFPAPCQAGLRRDMVKYRRGEGGLRYASLDHKPQARQVQLQCLTGPRGASKRKA
jgi:hypothetical protein